MPDYRTIRGSAVYTYEEKRSRFIATAAFADTEEAALAVLERVRAANRTARHNVYAYVLQNGRVRYSDDGEPAKTAGTPVLEAIGHAGVSDVIVVVTRYFGGILLGTGGLVRAYTAAAAGALAAAELVQMRSVVDCALAVPYAQYEPAQPPDRAGGRAAGGTGVCRGGHAALAHARGAGGGALRRAGRTAGAARAAVTVSPPHFAPF